MGRFVDPKGSKPDRFIKPTRKEDLNWYENNPWLIGGIVLLTALIIALIIVL